MSPHTNLALALCGTVPPLHAVLHMNPHTNLALALCGTVPPLQAVLHMSPHTNLALALNPYCLLQYTNSRGSLLDATIDKVGIRLQTHAHMHPLTHPLFPTLHILSHTVLHILSIHTS